LFYEQRSEVITSHAGKITTDRDTVEQRRQPNRRTTPTQKHSTRKRTEAGTIERAPLNRKLIQCSFFSFDQIRLAKINAVIAQNKEDMVIRKKGIVITQTVLRALVAMLRAQRAVQKQIVEYMRAKGHVISDADPLDGYDERELLDLSGLDETPTPSTLRIDNYLDESTSDEDEMKMILKKTKKTSQMFAIPLRDKQLSYEDRIHIFSFPFFPFFLSFFLFQ